MNDIDFINVDQYFSNLEWEGAVFPFGDGCISIRGCSFLEQEIFNFGDGYVKITGCSFDYKTNEEALNDGNQYKTKGEILDENFNVVGNLDMQGSLYYFHYYDHSIAITYDIEINLEGNIEKILSLNMMSKKDFIDSYHPSNSEQEIFNLGSGHIKITEDSFDQNTGYYKVLSEILDENSNVIGNLNIHGPLWNFYHDDYKINIHYGMEVNLKGDIKKILSL